MWIATSAALAIVATALATALAISRRRPGPGRDEPADPASGPEYVSAEILAAAFDEVATAAVIVDRDGQVRLRNRAAEPYGGGRHGEALIEASVVHRLEEARAGRSSTEDLHLHGPPERIVQIRGRPVLVNGETVGAIALVDDLTEPRRLDAMRRDFIANVSHELKTPVGALSLLAETLEDETDPEVIHRFSRRIRHETSRLAGLIDGLLDLSRVEGGDKDREVVAIDAVVGEAVAAVAPLASAADVEVVASPSDATMVVLGDRRQLVEAVINLLDNAVKFSSSGSRVTVESRRSGAEVTVAVSDSGVGIPHRDQHRVFERFYRVDRGRSSATGGSGLGLSIVRHVAVNHGGRVEVVSREGEGSTFTVVLPLVGGPGAEEQG